MIKEINFISKLKDTNNHNFDKSSTVGALMYFYYKINTHISTVRGLSTNTLIRCSLSLDEGIFVVSKLYALNKHISWYDKICSMTS